MNENLLKFQKYIKKKANPNITQQRNDKKEDSFLYDLDLNSENYSVIGKHLKHMKKDLPNFSDNLQNIFLDEKAKQKAIKYVSSLSKDKGNNTQRYYSSVSVNVNKNTKGRSRLKEMKNILPLYNFKTAVSSNDKRKKYGSMICPQKSGRLFDDKSLNSGLLAQNKNELDEEMNFPLYELSNENIDFNIVDEEDDLFIFNELGRNEDKYLIKNPIEERKKKNVSKSLDGNCCIGKIYSKKSFGNNSSSNNSNIINNKKDYKQIKGILFKKNGNLFPNTKIDENIINNSKINKNDPFRRKYLYQNKLIDEICNVELTQHSNKKDKEEIENNLKNYDDINSNNTHKENSDKLKIDLFKEVLGSMKVIKNKISNEININYNNKYNSTNYTGYILTKYCDGNKTNEIYIDKNKNVEKLDEELKLLRINSEIDDERIYFISKEEKIDIEKIKTENELFKKENENHKKENYGLLEYINKLNNELIEFKNKCNFYNNANSGSGNKFTFDSQTDSMKQSKANCRNYHKSLVQTELGSSIDEVTDSPHYTNSGVNNEPIKERNVIFKSSFEDKKELTKSYSSQTSKISKNSSKEIKNKKYLNLPNNTYSSIKDENIIIKNKNGYIFTQNENENNNNKIRVKLENYNQNKNKNIIYVKTNRNLHYEFLPNYGYINSEKP